MRMNSAKQSQMTAVASVTTKSSRHNILSDHHASQVRKNPEYQSEKRVKDDSLPKQQDGVFSELGDTASF